MPEHRGSCCTACPIVASVVRVVRESATVGLGSGKNVVLVRRISDSFMHVAFFVQGRNLVYAISEPSELDCVAM